MIVFPIKKKKKVSRLKTLECVNQLNYKTFGHFLQKKKKKKDFWPLKLFLFHVNHSFLSQIFIPKKMSLDLFLLFKNIYRQNSLEFILAYQ